MNEQGRSFPLILVLLLHLGDLVGRQEGFFFMIYRVLQGGLFSSLEQKSHAALIGLKMFRRWAVSVRIGVCVQGKETPLNPFFFLPYRHLLILCAVSPMSHLPANNHLPPVFVCTT
ncbi:MAG: hypothetical protein J3R72DRAFT_457874 [Linnemannia gamsii]|nr:MAG: hypothetical protein J3R72DRAFT_457874 [Linnemannia gamsii]